MRFICSLFEYFNFFTYMCKSSVCIRWRLYPATTYLLILWIRGSAVCIAQALKRQWETLKPPQICRVIIIIIIIRICNIACTWRLKYIFMHCVMLSSFFPSIHYNNYGITSNFIFHWKQWVFKLKSKILEFWRQY